MDTQRSNRVRRVVIALAAAAGSVVVGLAPTAAVALVNPQLTITGSPATTVGMQIFANSNLMGATNPTGTLTFRLYGPGDTSCTSPVFTSTVPVTGTSVNSERFTTTSSGTWRWTSQYSGDANHSAQGPTSCADPAATVPVDQARTVLSIGAPALGANGLHGTATLGGGFHPTGSITFNLHLDTPGDLFCALAPVFTSTVPVNGAATYNSADFVPLLSGTYKWRATYTGDANNRGVSLTACLDPAAAVVVSLTQPPPSPAGGRYLPLPPARILDTRNGIGGLSGPVGSGATVDVPLTGRGGVPSSGVTAVAMNVTVTQPTAAGWLTLYPSGMARPNAANLNFTPGETVANLVVVKVGAGGSVSLYNSAGATHVLFDVAGWYSDTTSGSDGRYEPLPPARILDSRTGMGGGARLSPGSTFDLQVSGRGGVPAAGVGAVVLNVAVTNTTAGSFLTVYPTGSPLPTTSNLGFLPGDTVSNRVMVKLGSGGKVSIYNYAGATDVVVDVNGWYADASAPVTSGGIYNALAPSRVLDTRDGTGGVAGGVGAGATVDVQLTGRGGVPDTGVSAVVLNATVTQPGSAGWVSVFPAGIAQPSSSDLNYAAGETRPNLVVVQVGAGGKVSLFSSTSTHVVFDVAGWIS